MFLAAEEVTARLYSLARRQVHAAHPAANHVFSELPGRLGRRCNRAAPLKIAQQKVHNYEYGDDEEELGHADSGTELFLEWSG
jgi:hypothetical protein